MKKYLVELIGTFFLVLTVGACVRSGAALAPVAIGGVLMVMIFAGGHVSGGHFNPAVTTAVFLRGKCAGADVVPYWVSQLLGAALAAVVIGFFFGQPATAAMPRALMPSLLAEFLFTFALAWVVLNTATAKGTAGNSFYGLAIGGTVMVGAVSVGGISGGAFNPAVGLGVLIMRLETLNQFFLYLAGPMLGGVAAAYAFKYVNSESAPTTSAAAEGTDVKPAAVT